MDVRLARDGTEAGRFAVDVADGDRAFAEELVALEPRVECFDLTDNFGDLVNGVVAFLGHRAVARLAEAGDTDFHAAALATEYFAIGRVGDDDHVGANLAFVDDVLPAEAVAVFFHHG